MYKAYVIESISDCGKLRKDSEYEQGVARKTTQTVSSGEDVTKVLIMTSVYKTHPTAKLRRFRQCQVIIE